MMLSRHQSQKICQDPLVQVALAATCPEWTCNSFSFFMKKEIDCVFYVLGNRTRRDILSTLSDEPMYFNQVSKEVGIGQQAMLRHMNTLEDVGFVNTHGEKSDLGAPDRKYYSLDSSFNLTISLSKDEFTIDYNQRKTSDDKLKGLFSRRWSKISSDPSLA